MTRAVAGVMLALLTYGCSGAPPASSTPGGTRQAYRATIATPTGDEIPFFLEIPSNCNVDRAVVINGRERISAPCQRHGSHVLVDFVVYGTRITADSGASGTLSGYWSRTSSGSSRYAFTAAPIPRLDPATRFTTAAAEKNAEAAGVWRIEFDSHELGKARFEASDEGVVTGTAEVPSEYGDLRYLSGNVRGSTVSLSTFDGTSAYMIRGRIDARGTMRGELIRGDGSRKAFAATRSVDFDVVDPLQRVRVTSAETRLDLAPLRSSRYAGKPVIVELFGTWCSNCNDLASLLVDLYREHREQGLEILGVSFEISDDDSYRRERVAAYKAQHGVEWEIVTSAGAPEDFVAAGPAKLSAIQGVPVVLFLNRDRTIRAVYTGFWGPATGASHQKAIATFQQLIADILASAPPRSIE